MGCMETDHNEPLFTNHITLLGLILPKCAWKKKNYFWEQVLWSDETKIELVWQNDVQKLWSKKGEAFLPKNTIPTLKHGGGSMTFWSCFSSRRTEQLIAIRGIMKSEDYVKILDENLQLSVQNLDQDNDPKCTSKSVTEWQELKVWINCQSPKNLQELSHVPIEEWKKSQKRLIQISSKNFRKKLQQVIKAMPINIVKIVQFFSIFHTLWIILSLPLWVFFFSYLVNLIYSSQI